jgi:hypothetical protein
MREQLITFETAKLAKEKGFDEPSFYYATLHWGKETALTKKDDYHAIELVNGQIKKFITTTDNRDDTRDFERNGLFSQDTLYITPENYTNYLKELLKDSLLVLPTQSFLQKWLREIHGIIISVNYNHSIKKYCATFDETYYYEFPYDWYNTYEEALERGLQEALLIIK